MSKSTQAVLGREQIVALVALLTPANVKRVYSGRPGCGCGCRGKYATKGALVSRTVSELKRAANLADVTVVAGNDKEVVFSVETPRRYRWVYVSANTFDALMAKV